ncbi:MAG: serine/threonine-protein kinase [Vicinamibacterales bacterium]
MERTTWGEINELFEAARRLPAEEREAWVRAATADEHVQAEVLSLLHAHEDDPWFVDQPGGTRTPGRVTPAGAWPGKATPAPRGWPAATPAPGVRQPPTPTPSRLRRAPAPRAGEHFAAYRLIREIARDPARAVFEAVAAGSSSHPRVALHVLAADASDPVVSARLHAQGDLLARLDHPAIPRLLNGGVTADGAVYLAFEYATGDAIDEWCRAHRLAVRERVDRVAAVCDAVQHAHERLVAHGDLRPSNILVPGDGSLKLLDCGMAGLLGAEAGPGGPAAPVHSHMSPEQARGEALTTASDVYALGILLYALLTGYPPYEIGGQTPARARQMICDTEPDVPSTIVSGADRRVLAGALDRVILKALSKNPRERYATAAALAADLRAWRDGRSLAAAPTPAWSRAGVGAAVIVALLAGAGVLGWQALQLRGERDEARASLAEARLERQAIEERLARTTVTDLRLTVAGAASDLAIAERRGGDLAKAEALWEQSLEDVRPALDAEPGDARVLEHAAAVRAFLGSLCRSERRFDDALGHYREALRARERGAALNDAPPSAPIALAGAEVDVARLLLDLVEVRPPSQADAARLREAGALIARAGPVVRGAAGASAAPADAIAELDRQSARLRRLTARRG